MVASNAKYLFSTLAVKCIALNQDKSTTVPLPGGQASDIEVIGGVGPFDFSGSAVTISAIPLSIKIDNGAVETNNIDLTAAVDPAAVTAAEMVTAITTAAFTGITASVDSRGYLKIAITTVTTETYLQVYGQAAELSLFGQGYGVKFIQVDTQQSVSTDPTLKDSDILSIIDGQGRETEVIGDGYRKGYTGVLTDTAMDDELRQLIEGGVYDLTNGEYVPPNSDSEKKYFAMEVLRTRYTQGSNLEEAFSDYVLQRYLISTGSFGSDPGDRNLIANVYNLVGTEYKDPVTSTKYSDSYNKYLTRAQLDALDWFNI